MHTNAKGNDTRRAGDKCKWLSEGYLGEVAIDFERFPVCKITIDPLPQFKIEFGDEKYVLLMGKGKCKKILGKVVDCRGSAVKGFDVIGKDGKLMLLKQEVLCLKGCATLLRLKEAHQKLRFEFDKSLLLVKVTAI